MTGLYLLFKNPKPRFSLRDRFLTNRAAGAVNATLAEPGPGGARTIIDGEHKLSIRASVLIVDFPVTSAWAVSRNTYPALTRTPGLTLLMRDVILYSASGMQIGFADATSLRIYGAAVYFTQTTQVHAYIGPSGGAYSLRFGISAVGVKCSFAVLLRSYGAHIFQLMAGVWLLVCESEAGNAAALYPCVANNDQQFTLGSLQVASLGWVPAPTASDSFDRANSTSVLGSSDGLGHVETTGKGAGGSGKAWTAQIGTWGIATNRAYCSALVGGVGLATIDAVTPDVIWRSEVYRPSAGNVGLVVRYADASNYVYAYLDGTNITVRKVLAGSDSEVVAPIVTTQSGHLTLKIFASGTKFIVYYNNLYVAEATIADAALQTGTGVGFYTTDVGNLFRGLAAAFPTGTDGRYTTRFTPYLSARTSHTFLPIGDSKTAAAYRYPGWMSSDATEFIESPARIAVAGEGTAQIKSHIDADLAAAVGTPEFVTYNLGANDAASSEADWKTNTLYILDALHVKYPSAKVYLMRIWKRDNPAFCNILAGWIADVVALRSSFVFLGPDERIFLEGGDNGASMTTDGVHPNIQGCVESAHQWRNVLGYA